MASASTHCAARPAETLDTLRRDLQRIDERTAALDRERRELTIERRRIFDRIRYWRGR